MNSATLIVTIPYGFNPSEAATHKSDSRHCIRGKKCALNSLLTERKQIYIAIQMFCVPANSRQFLYRKTSYKNGQGLSDPLDLPDPMSHLKVRQVGVKFWSSLEHQDFHEYARERENL